MHGKVNTWKMSEEQRLAYIKKNPIVPTEKPKGVQFSEVNTMSRTKPKERVKTSRGSVMDAVDKDELNKRYLSGGKLSDIAKYLSVSAASLSNYIKEQRKVEPEKWPYRQSWRK